MVGTETISEALWRDSREQILKALHHPFVRQLGDGSLPRDAFQFYVAQDAHFLEAFSSAYQAAVSKAAHARDSEAEEVLKTLLHGVAEELKLHASYAKEWGVDLSSELVPSPATKAYTDFLNAVAANEDVAHILAAMTPCSRLYGYLRSQLAKAYPNAKHAYTEWIRTYSSDSYHALPAAKEVLLNRLGKAAEFGSLRRLYRKAMTLEVDFFQAAVKDGRQPNVGLLVLDFDETLSVSDTTAVIIDTAIANAHGSTNGSENGLTSKPALEKLRNDLVSNYVKQRDKLLDASLPENAAEAQDFDESWMADFVQKLSSFDRKMNEAVINSGILKGIPKGALGREGRSIPLRPGAVSLLQRARKHRVPTHVLSVSWSTEMLRGALRGKVPVSLGEDAAKAGHVVVHANDMEYSPSGDSTGSMVRRIESGADKVAVLNRLQRQCVTRQKQGTAGLTVYIGDSMSDLAPLLSADVGIVIGQNKLLRRVAKAAGIQLKALVCAPSSGKAERGALYEAEDWTEIEAYLFGADPPNESAQVPRVLTIAGSDSGGGAGIQADLKTFAARGVFGASAITAVTEQNTHGVHGFHTVPRETLRNQIDCVLSDIGADVVKTGMLPSAEVVEVVAEQCRAHKVSTLVVDPVLVSTSGHSLGDSEVASALKERLFPLATVITPNLAEAAALLDGRKISSIDDMKAAARDLHALGPQYVLVKGGHLEQGDEAQDVLYDGETAHVLSGPRIDTSNTHGTGCTTASAIAAELAKGASVQSAARAAKTYVSEALHSSAALQIGTGSQRPFNHGYATADWLETSTAADMDLRLYAVTDAGQNERCQRSNAEVIEAAIQGGATFIQLREKDAPGGVMLREAQAALAVCRRHGVPLVINDRIDVAIACGAEGAHIGQEDLPVPQARSLLGPTKILGVSCKTVEQAVKAEAEGADYIGSGAVHPTTTKDSKVISLDTLADICAAVSIPVVAIGGMTADNCQPSIQAGCAGVAVVSAIFGAPDVAKAAAAIREKVDCALGVKVA